MALRLEGGFVRDEDTGALAVVGELGGDVTIDNVGVTAVPADPFGTNADAAAAAGGAGSIQAKLRLATAQLDAVQRAVERLDDTVGGTELQVDVVGSLPAGANAIGNVGMSPRTAGGLSVARFIDLDETDVQVKATAGQLFGWRITNRATAERFVKVYDDTTATVRVGTTTPALTIAIPAGAAEVVEFTNGVAFANAITAAATTGVADADTGAPAANDVVANFLFK